MRPLTRILTGTAIAATLAACGATTPDGGTGTTAQAQGAEVTIQDFAFGPESLEITAGTTVTWTNQDSFAHTVTSGGPDDPDGTFDEALGEPNAHAAEGTTASVTLDEPGTYAYFCDLHPSMVGEIVVTAP